jgi:hypothetical protein
VCTYFDEIGDLKTPLAILQIGETIIPDDEISRHEFFNIYIQYLVQAKEYKGVFKVLEKEFEISLKLKKESYYLCYFLDMMLVAFLLGDSILAERVLNEKSAEEKISSSHELYLSQ